MLYASTSLKGDHGFQLLQKAVDTLLSTVDVSPRPTILWSLLFEQRSSVSTAETKEPSSPDDHILRFPPSSLDLVFDEKSLERVKGVWQKIMGDEAETSEFLAFGERGEGVDEEQEDDE